MSDANEETKSEEKTMSPQQVDSIIADFEAKLASNAFAGRPFHNLVMEHLFPLLGDGSLAPDRFAGLVRKWAEDHYPWDWQVRSFLDE